MCVRFKSALSDRMHLKRAGPHLSLPHVGDDDDDDENVDSTCTLQRSEEKFLFFLSPKEVKMSQIHLF